MIVISLPRMLIVYSVFIVDDAKAAIGGGQEIDPLDQFHGEKPLLVEFQKFAQSNEILMLDIVERAKLVFEI